MPFTKNKTKHTHHTYVGDRAEMDDGLVRPDPKVCLLLRLLQSGRSKQVKKKKNPTSEATYDDVSKTKRRSVGRMEARKEKSFISACLFGSGQILGPPIIRHTL